VIFYLGPKVGRFWSVFSPLGVVVWAVFDVQAVGEDLQFVKDGGSIGCVQGVVGLG
jgi:hypothetical protein